MDDDIDIEEHDVLENPVIKNLFPDLSVLKKEIQSYNEFEPEVLQDQPSENSKEIIQDLTHNNLEVINYVQSYASHSSKVPLTACNEDETVSADNISFQFNKIILGSKPKKTLDYEEFFEKQVNKINYPTKVVVDDLGPYLERSNRYCRHCQILFPKKSSLDLHNQTIHSISVSMPIRNQKRLISRGKSSLTLKRYQCKLCRIIFSTAGSLARHHKNIHEKTIRNNKIPKILPVERNKKLKSTHNVSNSNQKCFHCNKMFPSQESLIDHMYSLISSKENLSKNSSNVGKSVKNTNIGKNEQRNESEKLEAQLKESTTRSETLYYQCNICMYYYEREKFMIRHLINIHKVERCSIKLTKVVFSKKCQHCDSMYSNVRKLNKHIFNSHEEQYRMNTKMSLNATNQGKRVNVPKRNEGNRIIDIDKASSNRSVHHQKIVKPTRHGFSPKRIIGSKNNIGQKPVDSNTSKTLYFQCNMCMYYFCKEEFLRNHLLKRHKVETILMEPSKVSFSGKCHHCSLLFPDIHEMNRHIAICHKKQYNMNTKERKKESINILSVNKKQSYESSRLPELVKNVPVHEFNSLAVPKKAESNLNNQILTPFFLQSTIFRCAKCDIHFLSAQAATNHIDHMELLINWKCSICLQIFKKEDKIFHTEQHSFSSNFTVHELGPTKALRVLYKCLKCAVHFTEDNIFLHYTECEQKMAHSVYCKVCDILIDKDVGRSHNLSHSIDNMKAEDFVIVESNIIENKHVQKDGKSIKRKLDEKPSCTTPPKKKKRALDFMLTMTYCGTCKCFITERLKREVHLNSQCGHIVKYVCKICGLVLTAHTYQTHKKLHRDIKNLKLQDFKFYDVGNNLICPPVPEFPKCNICEVHFITKAATLTHECVEDNYKTCNLCDIKLSEGAFKLHMPYHDYAEGKSSHLQITSGADKSILSNIDHLSNLMQPNNVTLESDLPLQITESFQSDLSVIVFSCRNCDVTVDTYDKVVEHCQEHYNRKEKQVTTKLCQTCDLKFDSTCYQNHLKSHNEILDVNLFKVLKFDSFYFTSENDIWIKHVFGTLPPEKIDILLSKSIYKYECRIKMEIIQDGPSELTVYKCDKCRCFIDSSLLYRHAENSCFKLRKHPCSICGLPFLSSVTRMEHETVHKTPNIGLKSFRIVTFNREQDEQLNKVLTNSRRQHVLHQCRNCNGIVEKQRIEHHQCNRKDLKSCIKCGLLIYVKEFDCHVMRHVELNSFTSNNLKVILFGEKDETCNNISSDSMVSSFCGIVCDFTFYSCTKCKICETNLPSKHKCSFGALRLKCPMCDLYFVSTKLKNHRKLHEKDVDFMRENMTVIKFELPESNEAIMFNENTNTSFHDQSNRSVDDADIEEELEESICHNGQDVEDGHKTVKIYKCSCGLHFLDVPSLLHHGNRCSPKIRVSVQQCSKCELLFTPKILFKHLLLHHGNIKYIFKYDIVEMSEVKNQTNCIYRCDKCMLHFISKEDADKHIKTCVDSETESKDCNFCNLRFSSSSLSFHQDRDHNEHSKVLNIINVDASSISRDEVI